MDLATRTVARLPKVEVMPYYNITVDFARQVDAHVLVHRLRMSADRERLRR